ncbi:MAG TPA: hypothetical protein VIV40_27955 [Kofleriaceae bacterium]
MRQVAWTLAALGSLASVAHADSGMPVSADMATESVGVEKSHRGVAQDYLVLPEGGELTAQMRFVTADSMLGSELEFSDLALFGISGRWSLFTKLELAASVELLPKQPSFTDEKPWQSVGVSLRSPLGRHVALALSGGGGHLLAHQGMWTGESLTLEWKKPIHEDFLSFDVQAGVNGLGLSSPNTTSSTAYLTEVAMQTTALFHEPRGHWGAWIGIAYAVPVQFSGKDPTTEVAIDPQPRLNFHMGTVLSAVKQWDIYVDFAVIDRGDEGNAATRLPILDGGFDQKQIIFGVTRHVDGRHKSYDRSDDGDDAVRLGSL